MPTVKELKEILSKHDDSEHVAYDMVFKDDVITLVNNLNIPIEDMTDDVVNDVLDDLHNHDDVTDETLTSILEQYVDYEDEDDE